MHYLPLFNTHYQMKPIQPLASHGWVGHVWQEAQKTCNIAHRWLSTCYLSPFTRLQFCRTCKTRAKNYWTGPTFARNQLCPKSDEIFLHLTIVAKKAGTNWATFWGGFSLFGGFCCQEKNRMRLELTVLLRTGILWYFMSFNGSGHTCKERTQCIVSERFLKRSS